MLRASIVIDYQNVHLTAHNMFAPYGPVHESLIDPVAFGRAAVRRRNDRQREGYPHAEATRVRVFRGLPHVDHDPEQHRRNLEQAQAWRTDGASVTLRDLKYDYRRDASGRPITDIYGKKEPLGPPREKGVDVLCALACMSEAQRDDVDLVILASRDTDLVPVLDELYDLHGSAPSRFARIETVAWFDRTAPGGFGGGLRATAPRRTWNTNLDRSVYEAAVDRRDYS